MTILNTNNMPLDSILIFHYHCLNREYFHFNKEKYSFDNLPLFLQTNITVLENCSFFSSHQIDKNLKLNFMMDCDLKNELMNISESLKNNISGFSFDFNTNYNGILSPDVVIFNLAINSYLKLNLLDDAYYLMNIMKNHFYIDPNLKTLKYFRIHSFEK
jgi:hypothetical protein